MKNVIISIVMLCICAALIVGVILPLAEQIRITGQKSFESVRSLSENIVEDIR